MDYDLNLTDSEMETDVESTPRHVPQDSRCSSRLDMPKLSESPFPTQHLEHHLPEASEDVVESEEVSAASPMKIILKRNQSSEWNVQTNEQDVVLPDRPALSGKQPMKLDKVVLNLKKSVSGSGTWNIAEKNNDSATQSANNEAQILPPKEERRGRKSKLGKFDTV